MSPTLGSGSLITGTSQPHPIEVAHAYAAKNFKGQERITYSPDSRCGCTSTLDSPPPFSPRPMSEGSPKIASLLTGDRQVTLRPVCAVVAALGPLGPVAIPDGA